MKRIAMLVPALGLAVACGAFLPADGIWTMTGETVVSDTCEFDDEGGEDGDSTFRITNNEDGTFTISDPENEDDFSMDCTLDKKAFTCAPNAQTIELDDTTDMIMTFSGTGSFADEESLSGELAIDVKCEGENCAVYAEYGVPTACAMTTSFNASLNAE